ncbi:putative PurR-regulated permease PerM [Natrinema hispanicum]|uniref:Putative PurR-regulated permease PerM n=1 Tax=Natrinema hispanicum TaxID=392421 RepID=A0A482YCV9_9EURY|nr:AI-2E family transporter [Natrinema hispanicum]RZV11308.1 putative PurR-regulated permease PerM [Natrinema hispanicum]
MGVLRGRDGTRLLWTGLGLVIAVLIGLALFRYVGTLLFAIFVYYATRPLYRWLDRYLEHPNVTATVTILFVVIPMVAVIGYAGVVALGELDRLLATSSLETYRSVFQPYLRLAREGHIGRLREMLGTGMGGSVAGTLAQRLPSAVTRLSSIAGFVFSVLARFFLMLTFLFYLLRDDHKLRHWFYDSVDHDERIVEYTTAVDGDLETVFVSNLAVIAVAAGVATATYVGLNVFASSGSVVATPVLLSLLIGIGTLIPAVGMKIVYVPYGLLLLGLAVTTATPLWHPIAFFALTFVVVDTIPDFFARSFLSARSGVHMGLVLLGYFLGTLAFGWYGLFLGPIVVVLAVHFADKIFPDLVDDLFVS